MRQVIFTGLSETPALGELPEGVTATVISDDLWINVPKGTEWVNYILSMDNGGDIYVTGEGDGSVTRYHHWGSAGAFRYGKGRGYEVSKQDRFDNISPQSLNRRGDVLYSREEALFVQDEDVTGRVVFNGLSTTPSEGTIPEGVKVEVKGDNLLVNVPRNSKWFEYVLDSSEKGNIYVAGAGWGTAVRSGSGLGGAERRGRGWGDAVRSGSGDGNATNLSMGDTKGCAINTSTGHGGTIECSGNEGAAADWRLVGGKPCKKLSCRFSEGLWVCGGFAALVLISVCIG